MPTIYHMVHYRKFGGEPSPGTRSLEQLCRDALGTPAAGGGPTLWLRPQDRLLNVGAGGRQILLNKVADLSSSVFGELCLADTRGLQALLQSKAQEVELSDLTTAGVYELDERSAPTGSQFIRGMAYWLATNNNIFFVKTSNMTGDHLRDYLAWLLQQATTTLAMGAAPFSLQAEFDKSQVAGEIGDITGLKVGGTAQTPAMRVNTDDSEDAERRSAKTSRRVADKQVAFDGAIPILDAVFGKAKSKSLVNSLGPDEYITVDTDVRIRGRRTEKSKARLRDLVNNLAETSDAAVRVEGKDGKVSGGDAILRTNMPFDVAHDGANLLEFDNVADQLQEVYFRFVKDGKINA